MEHAFQLPSYDVVACTFTALGALAAFGKLSQARVRTWALSYIFDIIFGKSSQSDNKRIAFECLVFVSTGIVVAVGVTQPSTPMQAIAAGLSWAAILGKFK